MSAALLLLFGVSAGVAGWALTGLVLRYALHRNVLDVPNHRSAHVQPTPRGGGAAIAAVLLAGLAGLAAAGVLPVKVAAALGGGGILIAGIGWLDDHGGVRARNRFFVHLAAAVWALAWLGGLPRLSVGTGYLALGRMGWIIGALGIVWATNLYNFMDGIDGIAGGIAVAAGAIGGGLLLASGNPGLASVAVLTAGAAAGFLAWNWPPARIFMGDVGSGLLGFVFAVIALASERGGSVPLLAWVLLLGVFVVDATSTLLRRMARRERWAEPHREHAYQRALRVGHTHRQVSTAAVGITLVLGALAAAACWRPALLLPALAVGTGILFAAYLWVESRSPMRPPPVQEDDEDRPGAFPPQAPLAAHTRDVAHANRQF